MSHEYDRPQPARNPEQREAEVKKYYDLLRTAREDFVLRKQQNDCPVWDVNDVKILSKMGVGSFAITFRAEARTDCYAIKCIEKLAVRSEGMCKSVVNEKIFTYATRGCPFIIELFACFKDQPNLYLIMECADHGTLEAIQEMYAYRVPEDIVRRVKAQLVLGLQYMHACGVMHRDLKEDNILVSTRGRIKIADLGQVSDLPSGGGYGSIYYRAPEAYLDNFYNEAVDWWALGILMYTLITDEHPFCEKNDLKDPAKVYALLVGKCIKFDRPEVANTSEAFKGLVSQLLEPNPSERIGSLREGSRAVHNREWFKTIDWYDMLYGGFQLGLDYKKLEGFAIEGDESEPYPFKGNLPDSEDSLNEEFKDF